MSRKWLTRAIYIARRQGCQVGFKLRCFISFDRILNSSCQSTGKGTESSIRTLWLFRGCKFTAIQSYYQISFMFNAIQYIELHGNL